MNSLMLTCNSHNPSSFIESAGLLTVSAMAFTRGSYSNAAPTRMSQFCLFQLFSALRFKVWYGNCQHHGPKPMFSYVRARSITWILPSLGVKALVFPLFLPSKGGGTTNRNLLIGMLHSFHLEEQRA